MDINQIIETLSALAQTTRLETFRLLVSREPEGVPAGEIARLVNVPQNTMSAHLAVLARAGLVRGERRSRTIIYRAEIDRLQGLVTFLLQDCCGGRLDRCASLIEAISPCCPPVEVPPMTQRPYNVLFLCTGNSARSILAESILRQDGAGRFQAFSAGSQPKGEVNPIALKVLGSFGYPTDGFRSKSWDEFATPDAPKMDFIFTVCDSAAGETCPTWPGKPATAHWGIDDPASIEGSAIEKERAFNDAFRFMRNRIAAFIALPMTKLDALALKTQLNEIGHMAGASATE